MKRKRKNRQIDFEEVVSDTLSASTLGVREMAISPIIFRAIISLSIFVGLVFLGRIMFFTGIDGERYVKRSEANINQDVPLIAPRGIILDRFGEPIIKNDVIFSVFLQLDEMIRNNERDMVLNAAENILGLDRDNVASNLNDTNIDSITDVILARDITRDQVIEIETLGIRSLIVENDYKRNYIDPAFSHIIGYVSLVDSNDLISDENLTLNDLIGRAGLEGFYDKELRGVNGSITIYRNAIGNLEDIERTREPIGGEVFNTTIDAEFQKYFYSRMIQGLDSLGRTSGVGIAINPENGEILALASFPSFDANNVSNYLENTNKPLFNRAISGLYSPGSTIKPIHGTAALVEGVVDADKQIFSAGYIEIPNPFFPDKPSIFVDWKPHGWVNIHSALARSSNVYFYVVSGGFEELRGVGIVKLKEYWQKFGLGKPTGIDLPGEAVGFLPSPEEKEERTGSIWRVGDTYNVAIGQGNLRITPIELLNSTVAIAEGKAFAPHIKKDDSSEVIIDLSDFESVLPYIRTGMEDAVNKSYGTANSLSNLPVSVAAKTGSAQTSGNTKTNALFIGYSPAEDPKIAILVLIEDAREGSLNAIPIARDVFGWYYENRLKQ